MWPLLQRFHAARVFSACVYPIEACTKDKQNAAPQAISRDCVPIARELLPSELYSRSPARSTRWNTPAVLETLLRETIAAILVAAGRGERAGGTIGVEGPKQYRAIHGKPVIRHTLDGFLANPRVGRIVVAVHPDDGERLRAAIGGLWDRIETVEGGPTRQASVLEALRHLSKAPPQIVLIHDAVRPFVDADLIDRTIEAAMTFGGALPVMPVTDTLKSVSASGIVERTLPRDRLHGAQTPQTFRFDLVRDAHERAAKENGIAFTDDASIVEWAGGTVAAVPGTADNVKLTTASDIAAADRHLRRREPMIDVRTGNGYDVHQLVDGDHVTLCGVRIAHDQALLGHSDADVGLHALTDALLATCGAGDIGTHFPPSDPQWRGAASHIFVRHAVRTITERSGRICNVDITLIAEAPRIGPHREAMQAAIADMTGLAHDRISVKATTNETIGFIGRREGIAAIATASVVYGD